MTIVSMPLISALAGSRESSAPASDACDLCGGGLPTRPVTDALGRRHCCHGCAHVSAILDAVGLESEAGQRAVQAARRQGLLAAVAPDRAQTASPRPDLPPVAREEVRMRVEGLACPSCAWLVEAVLEAQPGVASARVDYISDTAQIVFDLRQTNVEALTAAVEEAGHRLIALHEPLGRDERRELFRIVVAGAVAMNLMMLAFVGYDAFLYGISHGFARVLDWLQLVMAIPVVTWCALPIYRKAAAALRTGRVVMETLLSIGVLAAAAISFVAVATGQASLYLETATTLVTLALGGRALERHFKRRAAKSLTGILRFAPTKARLEIPEHPPRFVALGEIRAGDTVIVEEGETVPLDLRLETEAVLREGLLSGEPHPVHRRPGESVLAGSVVESGPLRGRVERAAGETVADLMRERVEEALRRADVTSRYADRIAQGFVPLVLLVALASLLGHAASGAGLMPAVMASVSVLVVACPCAFGVASSSALSLAVLRLARAGVIVKDPRLLEAASRLDTVIFDKTGTLTRGDLSLVSIGWTEPARGSHLLNLEGIQAIEQHSRHPAGISLTRALPHDPSLQAEGVVEIPGLGITGTVGGRRLAAGKADLFSCTPVGDPTRATRIYFGEAGEAAAGHIDLADALRPEARSVVAHLHSLGLAPALLSGDSPAAAAAVAAEAGITEAEGGLSPERKAGRVRALCAAGRRVAFIGDGFNDAEAMASATLGVALASGADLAMVSAPAVVTRGDLRAVLDLIAVARRAVRVMRQTLLWSFGYNAALIPVAALGLLAPVHAAALMALSSVTVALNSLRVRRIPLSAGALEG